jgi:SAM-dependent methyltransferase
MEFCTSDDWRLMLEELILPVVLRDLDLGDDVIEIGPGPGFTTDVLRRRGDRVTAVEIDEVLAERLRQRFANTNIAVVCRDATHTGLESDRFSGAASFNMLHHVPTSAAQDAILAELARVLRPGGLLVAADGVYDEAVLEFHRGDTYNPMDPDELPSRLRTAGFDDIDVGRFDFGWMCTARRVTDPLIQPA